MPKTLKDYLLEGGVKGKLFERDKDTYFEVEDLTLSVNLNIWLEVVNYKKDSLQIQKRMSIPLRECLKCKEYISSRESESILERYTFH